MASNYHINGGAVAEAGYDFPTPVSVIHIYVDTGVVFLISFDGGDDYLRVPAGFTSMSVGLTKRIMVTSDGEFTILGSRV